jgi:hypothetical protein
LRAITVGLAVTAGCTAIGIASIGAGYYAALALNAAPASGPELAYDAAEPRQLPLTAALVDEEVKLSPIFARFPAPDAEFVAATPALNIARSFALVAANTPGADTTGTVPIPAPKPAPPPMVASVAMFSEPKTSGETAARPPRRTLPQLASLSPPGMKIAPQAEPMPARTAIYDITAKTVYMPSGEKLEAHSGFGMFMDDPRHVHRKMRGATPPNTYRLRLRERLFHGVQAIRMTPENEGEMYARTGILAHSYMLGASGQSNGCISFKDYPKFLRAFQRGEVDRITVVARLDKPPAFYARNDNGARNANAM